MYSTNQSAVAAADSPAPTLVSPIDGEQITDLSTYFQWLPINGCDEFEIQVARDAAFEQIQFSKHTINKGFHKNLYFPKDVLPAGSYFWRVRALPAGDAGSWSSVRSLGVDIDHSIRADVVRDIGPKTPLFLMRSRTWDPIKYAGNTDQIIPPGLRHVIVVDDLAMSSAKVIDRARQYESLGLDFVIWNNRCQVSLATIEYCFQKFTHCIGTAEGEHFSGMYWERGPEGNLSENDFVHRAWMLCGKYGRFYFFADGDGGSYRWPAFARRERDVLLQYHRNIVPMFKTTNGDMALHSYGAVQGLMACGYVDNCGIWDDEWIWPCSGFGTLGQIVPDDQVWALRRKLGTRQCPWVYDIQMWLMGIASGSTVFQLESAHQWGPQGTPAPQYERVFLPFVRAVVEHELIPSRKAFIDQIKVGVVSNPDLVPGKHNKQYTGPFAYLKELYALKDRGDREFIPNDSRYGMICLLPPDAHCLNPSTRLVPQEQLTDVSNARTVFDAAYPRRFTGDAFMWECDGTVIVTNSNENQDIAEHFDMPLVTGPVRRLSGPIGVHQYLIGKIEKDGSFWFQANDEYSDRHTDVTLTCPKKPRWQVTPAAAVLTEQWDESTSTLTLGLSHKAGAVDVWIRP